MITLEQVNKIYPMAGGDVHALKDVDLSISRGEHVVVTGMSGSGKSTLLNMISGIDRPSSGSVTVGGQLLNELDENELALWRGRNIGIVFQFYQLFPTLTALDNVLFAMNLVDKIPANERRERSVHYLRDVGLGNKITKYPNELSGGERQRVAIARSMANDPMLIISDEPTGNLDSSTGNQIKALFNSLNERGTTLVTITHENVAKQQFDRVVHIKDGTLSQSVEPGNGRTT